MGAVGDGLEMVIAVLVGYGIAAVFHDHADFPRPASALGIAAHHHPADEGVDVLQEVALHFHLGGGEVRDFDAVLEGLGVVHHGA